jgi:protein-L-isoaspartate(D-aspartate) O-methyltransferase
MAARRIALVTVATAGIVCAAPAVAVPQEVSAARMALVAHLQRQGISDERVLEAMRAVPRHEFVPDDVRSWAYEDTALPIGSGQTISQPYIVALMSELLACGRGERILEIGTGSGYQAAVLAEMGCEVFSVEILRELGERAAATLARLGYVARTRIGDGYAGWPEEAPFDGVIVTAAPEQVPSALIEQLAPEGRMVIPVGPTGGVQELLLLRKQADGSLAEREIIPVRFVPMVRRR